MHLSYAVGALALVLCAFAPDAAAQPQAVGERLIAQSGAPERFALEADEQSIVIVDRASGLRCSIPPNAPEISLSVRGDLMQCGYTGGIYSIWMVVPATSRAGQAELDRFVAAYAVFQREQMPSLDIAPEQPGRHPALQQIFPNAPEPFRVWLQDTRPGVDQLVSLIAADMNGHRVMQMVMGPADPVTAISEMSFVTATSPH